MDWRDFVETHERRRAGAARGPGGHLPGAWISPPATAIATPWKRWRGVTGCPSCEIALRRRALCGSPRAATDTIARHVGYYLIDRRRGELEQRLGVRPPLGVRWRGAAERTPLPIYLGCWLCSRRVHRAAAAGGRPRRAAGVGVVVDCRARRVARQSARPEPAQLARDARCGAATAAAHGLLARASRPARARWWWCPACSASVQDIEDLVEALEVRFLANRDGNLHFALLTDFVDAASATLPGDEASAAAGAAPYRGPEPALRDRRCATASFCFIGRASGT